VREKGEREKWYKEARFIYSPAVIDGRVDGKSDPKQTCSGSAILAVVLWFLAPTIKVFNLRGVI
jgi:hypothetical protein